MRFRIEKEFFSSFDEKTGAYLRISRTGREPFMSSFPELLDIGIMGHCIYGKLGLCIQAGVECYQDGLNSTRQNMTLDDFAHIARQCRGRTYQFALGGCGDPDQHENFADILKICRENKIVPNYTTSGFGLSDEIVALTKEYCGAVAVSWYRSKYTLLALEKFIKAGVKTNIHFVLSKRSIDEALRLLKAKESEFPDGVNAIVFLLHKPVGLGTRENVLKINDIQEFINLVTTQTYKYKIGFDSCTVPALINNPGIIDTDSLDTCEGARWSAYITSDMKMLPCSFDNQFRQWQIDLRNTTIEEAWNSEIFDNFRNKLKCACPDCSKRDDCMGGCPICPEIVLCEKRKIISMS